MVNTTGCLPVFFFGKKKCRCKEPKKDFPSFLHFSTSASLDHSEIKGCFLQGVVTSWQLHLSPYQAAQVRALVWAIVLCSWARHFTLTVSLSIQCINGYWQVQCFGGGGGGMDLYPVILLVASNQR